MHNGPGSPAHHGLGGPAYSGPGQPLLCSSRWTLLFGTRRHGGNLLASLQLKPGRRCCIVPVSTHPEQRSHKGCENGFAMNRRSFVRSTALATLHEANLTTACLVFTELG